MTEKLSRRTLATLLPVLVSALRAQNKRLPSKVYPFAELPSKTSAASISHAVLDGETNTGYPIEAHITELNAGASPHPPHQHVHDEMIFLQSGTIEATLNGKTERLTPGSLCYFHSNDLHAVHNPGPDRAVYFVIALGPK